MNLKMKKETALQREIRGAASFCAENVFLIITRQNLHDKSDPHHGCPHSAGQIHHL